MQSANVRCERPVHIEDTSVSSQWDKSQFMSYQRFIFSMKYPDDASREYTWQLISDGHQKRWTRLKTGFHLSFVCFFNVNWICELNLLLQVLLKLSFTTTTRGWTGCKMKGPVCCYVVYHHLEHYKQKAAQVTRSTTHCGKLSLISGLWKTLLLGYVWIRGDFPATEGSWRLVSETQTGILSHTVSTSMLRTSRCEYLNVFGFLIVSPSPYHTFMSTGKFSLLWAGVWDEVLLASLFLRISSQQPQQLSTCFCWRLRSLPLETGQDDSNLLQFLFYYIWTAVGSD